MNRDEIHDYGAANHDLSDDEIDVLLDQVDAAFYALTPRQRDDMRKSVNEVEHTWRTGRPLEPTQTYTAQQDAGLDDDTFDIRHPVAEEETHRLRSDAELIDDRVLGKVGDIAELDERHDGVISDITLRRRQLGRLLRRAREAIHPQLTHQTGEAYELRQLAERDQSDGAARTEYSTMMAAFGVLADVEPQAREIRCWHSERIPGPLQSEMYLLKQHESVLANSHQGADTLSVQKSRANVFMMPNPPLYRVILSESSLHRMPGGRNPQLVAEQVEHLLKLMDTYPRLELRILTFDVDVPWVENDFQHLMFTGDDTREFVYIEHTGGSRTCNNSNELKEFRDHWDMLDAAALDEPASRKFLIGLVERGDPSAR